VASVPPTPLRSEDRAKIRIAIIDDERSLAESCATVASPGGVQLDGMGAGQEALDALAHRPFDIVLTDLYLPQVDGLSIHQGGP